MAALAREAGVARLVPFHLSKRDATEEWEAVLGAARAVFPATRWPAGWFEGERARGR